jgi:hypothetical protein
MRIALALVVLGGLLYLEALRGWLQRREEQFRAALRDMAWSTEAFRASTRDLADALQASQHAWGNAVDLVLYHDEPWHYHVHVDPR